MNLVWTLLEGHDSRFRQVINGFYSIIWGRTQSKSEKVPCFQEFPMTQVSLKEKR